ncbi:MAG: hypothetical protein E5X77_30395 [Mesorhizobium sp.]|nr:MAG: hypothetical protein E5X77_30395 [Mesorhizobium sp.]
MTDMAEDEQIIRSGYQLRLGPVLAAIPLATAYFLDIKWVIAISAAVLISMSHESGGRQYDLCIRLRRATSLLWDIKTKLKD